MLKACRKLVFEARGAVGPWGRWAGVWGLMTTECIIAHCHLWTSGKVVELQSSDGAIIQVNWRKTFSILSTTKAVKNREE
jgi:hypothetical protein